MAWQYGRHIHRYFMSKDGRRFLALPSFWHNEISRVRRNPDWKGAARRVVDSTFGRKAVETRLARINSTEHGLTEAQRVWDYAGG